MNAHRIVDAVLGGGDYARKLAKAGFDTRQQAERLAVHLRSTLFKEVTVQKIKPVARDPGTFYYGKPFRAVYRVELKPEVYGELSRDIKQLHSQLRSEVPPAHVVDWVKNRFLTTLPAVLANAGWLVHGNYSMRWDRNGPASNRWTGTFTIDLRVPPPEGDRNDPAS